MKDKSGKTALEIAEKAGHTFFLSLLQEHKNQCAQQSKTVTEFQECMEQFTHSQEQKSERISKIIIWPEADKPVEKKTQPKAILPLLTGPFDPFYFTSI